MPEYDETENGAVAATIEESTDVEDAGAVENPDTVEAPVAVAGEDNEQPLGASPDDEDFDPVKELREALRFAPGDWYVVHSYAGYENRVKANL